MAVAWWEWWVVRVGLGQASLLMGYVGMEVVIVVLYNMCGSKWALGPSR